MPGERKRRFRKYQVKEYQRDALRTLTPPDEMTVSEWAERYRHLTERNNAIPGPWRNERTPYLIGIMNEFNSCDTEEIILVKPAQYGGTEAILNILGYLIHQDPADTMVVYPNEQLAERISESRVKPSIRACKPLREKFREFQSKADELRFSDMSVYLVGAGSPANLASSPIRFLFLDEVDKFPEATKKEANPISLARERTKTFRNRKIFLASTPTLKTGYIWNAMERADEIRHYFVPCPHCGEFIELKFNQIKFPSDESMSYADRAELAVYVCQKCNGIITDRHKSQMLRYGEWRAIKKSAKTARTVAFWSNTLYSPFTRFSEIAREFLVSKDDPEQFQNFTNSWLAEPWEDTKLKTSADLVLERQTELQAYTVPEWARLLTAGVDVQETSLYWTIRAWGPYLTSQNIAHGQAYSFADVERIMNLQYMKENGNESMLISLALMDSGDNTDLVYDFCANNSDWCIPSKGASHAMDTHFRLSKVNKTDSRAYGMTLAIIDTGKYKDMIAGRMRKPNGTGSWMVYQGCDRDYAEQVTAEHKVIERTGSRETKKWVPKSTHADNHYLDCEVYAMCAADMLGVRTLHLEQVEAPRASQQPEPVQSTAQGSDWISGAAAGSWLGG